MASSRNFVAGLSLVALIGFALAALLAVRQPVEAQAAKGALSAAERAEVESIVHDYILANPEIIPEAINNLQQREVARMIDSNREDIETPFEGAWAGKEDASVVLVEFFDYNCPYCRQSNAVVQKLLAEDENLKVVWRDFPVLGPESRRAAMGALSAAKQDKYRSYHDLMFADERRLSQEKLFDVIRKTGLDEVATANDLKRKALEDELDSNLALGRALGLGGTPAYVIGDQILEGAVGYEALKTAIAEARAEEAAAE
ncbi:DsbA family protein [Pacificimonas sp. ICDLI1SI03]